jgi:hypothetical protein
MNPDSSILAGRVESWISQVHANRAVIQPLAETTQFIGRVRGVPCIAVTAASEAAVSGKLRGALHDYAQARLAAGKELPMWERAVPQVSPQIVALVRMSTLRRLLKERASQWGAPRQNLPAGVCEHFLADLDQLLTRHAMALEATLKPLSGTPPDDEKGGAA